MEEIKLSHSQYLDRIYVKFNQGIELNANEQETLNDYLIRVIDTEAMHFIEKYSGVFKRIILNNEFGLNNDAFIFYRASYRMVSYMSSLMNVSFIEFCSNYYIELYIDAYSGLMPFYINGLPLHEEKLNSFECEIVSYFGEPESKVSIYDNLLNGKIHNTKHETIINILYDCCGSSTNFKTFLKSYISTLNNNFHFLIHLLEILIGKEILNDEKSKLLGFFSTDYDEFNQCLQDYIDIN
jgi:hypothetical protein